MTREELVGVRVAYLSAAVAEAPPGDGDAHPAIVDTEDFRGDEPWSREDVYELTLLKFVEPVYIVLVRFVTPVWLFPRRRATHQTVSVGFAVTWPHTGGGAWRPLSMHVTTTTVPLPAILTDQARLRSKSHS